MAVLGRINLQALFKNGSIPTEQDFRDLIDSAVNKRDDHFFGRWEAGTKYCEGDVVLYKKSLYMLVLEEGVGAGEECEEEENGTVTQDKSSGRQCICSDVPPGPDNKNWCLLELEIEDDDWHVVRPEDGGDPEVMYTKVMGIRVGIGTEEPAARLDVTDGDKGQFLFDPDGEADPAFQINNLDPKCHTSYLKNMVGDRTDWLTDAPLGYLFKQVSTESEESESSVEQKSSKTKSKSRGKASKAPEALWLMLVTSREGEPRVGIGMNEDHPDPQATLDVLTPEKGQILANPGSKKDPELILINLEPASDKNYLASSVGSEASIFTTDAGRGFRFKLGKEYDQFIDGQDADHGKTVVAIDGNGKVGIGTEDPQTHLHVTDNKSGEFRMGLNNPNPGLAIINLRTKQQANYLTLGADNDQSAFVTDSEDGFVFRIGDPYGNKGAEENINQGEDLLRIHPKCKEGDYEKGDLRLTPTLDTKGISRAYAQYTVATRNECEEAGPLENSLQGLSQLNPIRFNWDESKTRCGDIGEQLGLRAHEVEEYFPQVVMKAADGGKGIAYQNLVPALIDAIKELSARVEELEKQLGEAKE